MRKKFNVKFFAVLVGVIVLLAAAVHYLHGFQVKRNAKTFLEQAREAKENRRFYQACELYSSYLSYYPDKAETLVEYGELLDELSVRDPKMRSRAYAVLDKALRLNRDADKETRRRTAKLAMSLGLFSEAKDHWTALLAIDPADAENAKFQYLCG